MRVWKWRKPGRPRRWGGEEREHPTGRWVPPPRLFPPSPAAPYDVEVWAPRTAFAAGDNLTVTCRAKGNPPPRFRWELPTNTSWELRDGGATVTVPVAQGVHGGTYRCLAENRYGTGAASVDILFQGEGAPGGTVSRAGAGCRGKGVGAEPTGKGMEPASLGDAHPGTPGSIPVLFPAGSPRSPVIPMAVTLAVLTVLVALAVSWWFYRARGWTPMPEGSSSG